METNNKPSSAEETNRLSSKRLWLIPVILIAIAAAAYFSAQNRQRQPSETVTLGDGRTKLIEFGMGVCSQCKRMKPVMEKAKRELSDQIDVHILDIRVEANESLADKFEMRTMPLIVLVDGSGKELWRHDGFVAFNEISHVVNQQTQTTGGICESNEMDCQ